jgi:hypothetical protein
VAVVVAVETTELAPGISLSDWRGDEDNVSVSKMFRALAVVEADVDEEEPLGGLTVVVVVPEASLACSLVSLLFILRAPLPKLFDFSLAKNEEVGPVGSAGAVEEAFAGVVGVVVAAVVVEAACLG